MIGRRKQRKEERKKAGPFSLEILRQKIRGGTANSEETLGGNNSCCCFIASYFRRQSAFPASAKGIGSERNRI